MTASAPAELRQALADAASTLDYHAKHPALMKACAYFLKTGKEVAKFFEDNPDARIATINTTFEVRDGQ